MADQWDAEIEQIGPDRPVLIAGCTASGKSALALRIAEASGGTIINADALQVYANWSVLTARPSPQDVARAPHALYGHVPGDVAYTVGDWLRDITPLLSQSRPIVVGGTGLFFRALTEGLADIPQVPEEIRTEGGTIFKTNGLAPLIAALDAETQAALDMQNPARVLRAWEVQAATGRSMVKWHADTPAPLMPLSCAVPIVLDAAPDWLEHRIGLRFDLMLHHGALDEIATNAPGWDPTLLSSKAIGAEPLMAYYKGECTLAAATESAVIATRQYAKRQRTWFRKRMADWHKISLTH